MEEKELEKVEEQPAEEVKAEEPKAEESKASKKVADVEEKSSKVADKFGGKNVSGNRAALIAFIFAAISLSAVAGVSFIYGSQDWIQYLVAFIVSIFLLPLPIIGLGFGAKGRNADKNPFKVFGKIAKPVNIVCLILIALNVLVYLGLWLGFLIKEIVEKAGI